MTSQLYGANKSKLQWKKNPNVALYEIEVRNTLTQDIQKFKTADDYVWVELGLGLYEMRVKAYNKQGTFLAQSDWIPLTVRQSYQPEIRSFKRSPENPNVITIKGKNLYAETRVSIQSAKRSVSVQITNHENRKKLTLHAPLEENTKYYLKASNPGDYKDPKILHTFTKSRTMLFDNEYQYERYFSPVYAEFRGTYQDLQTQYWQETYSPGVTSFDITGGYHLLSWIGLAGGLEYHLYKNAHTVGDEVDLSTHFFIPKAGLFLCYRHKDFIPYIAAYAGYALSYLSVSNEVHDLTYNSSDFYNEYNGGVRIFVWRKWFVDPSFSYSQIDLLGDALISYDYNFGIGYYF